MSEPNKPLPGYGGFVPKSEVEVMPDKTAMNKRMPLDQRVTPLQATRRAVSQPAHTSDEAKSRIRSYFLPKRHVGYTTYTEQSTDYVKSAADVPPRAKEPISESDKQALPKFVAKTEKQIATHTANGQVPDYFSRVRKIEKEDDDARRNVTVAPTRSGAAHNLRTVDISRKRENDESLRPPKEEFVRVQKRTPNGLPPPAPCEQVKLTALPPHTSHELEFADPRPRMDTLLKTAATEQMSKTATKLMTLTASTRDMFEGTAKARSDVIPGYMGHVPAAKSNTQKVKADAEVLRQFSKCSVRLSAPPAVVPGYGGYCPDSGTELDLSKGALTASQRMQADVVNDVGHECLMNKRDGTGRKNAVRGFFSSGVGQQDSIIADQFCSRYRPLEGVMKMGPPSQRNWTTEKELRRRITM